MRAREHSACFDLDLDPESKIELIDGQLICGTIDGSLRTLWTIVEAMGPKYLFPMASADDWLGAMARAFSPDPGPETPAEWDSWSQSVGHEPEVPTAGPRVTLEHRSLRERVNFSLYSWSEAFGVGYSTGPDFVLRLGEHGFTPDTLFLLPEHLDRMRHMFCDGAADIVVEILQPANQEQEIVLKRREYARGGVPEYWIVDPFTETAEFLGLDPTGGYTPLAVDADGVFRSSAVPYLAFKVDKLWDSRVQKFDPTGLFEPPPKELWRELDSPWQDDSRYEELTRDTLPFEPTPALDPIRPVYLLVSPGQVRVDQRRTVDRRLRGHPSRGGHAAHDLRARRNRAAAAPARLGGGFTRLTADIDHDRRQRSRTQADNDPR